MQLWNIRTSKLVYTFTGWGSAVLAVVQSPAVDVVGVGLESGGVVLHNLRYDETLMRFQQEWGPVISLSFRTGKSCQILWYRYCYMYLGLSFILCVCQCVWMCADGINTVASGSPSGNIAVWDLDKRRLGTVVRDAHRGAVSGLQV